MSSPFELFFWVWTNWFFHSKWCHVGLASICHFLVLDPHLKGMGPIYGSPPIGLLYFIGPSSKVALIITWLPQQQWWVTCYVISRHQRWDSKNTPREHFVHIEFGSNKK
jgi:hypothetical protein